MKLSEYAQRDATELARLVKKKEISPIEILDCTIGAIESLNPSLNAISVKTYEYARRQLDEEFDISAPFAGVPFMLKDVDALAKGIKASCGSRLIDGLTTERDTEFVGRLKKAGFIIVATTTTPECCYTSTTESVLHGATYNPWDISLSTGGSSGGSAAAVASAMVPVAHGTDAGGSIRQPSSWCGTVGLKPSRFRTPYGPAESMQFGGVSTEFVLTRTIRDTAGILDAVSGADSGHFATALKPETTFMQSIAGDPGPLRIAYTTTYPLGGEISQACLAALMETVELLKGLGHELREAFPVIDTNIHTARRIIQCSHIAAQLDAASAKMNRPVDERFIEKQILEAYEIGKRADAQQYIWAQDVNNKISRSVGGFMEDYDIILCPTVGVLPIKIGDLDGTKHPEWSQSEWTQRKSSCTHFTNPFNATGQPSISIPLCVSAEGLPIGMELTAAMGREDLVLALSSQLERVRPWIDRQPQIFTGR